MDCRVISRFVGDLLTPGLQLFICTPLVVSQLFFELVGEVPLLICIHEKLLRLHVLLDKLLRRHLGLGERCVA